jgi:hypothetical protein
MDAEEMYRQWISGNRNDVAKAMIDCTDENEIHEFTWLLRKGGISAAPVFLILLDIINQESNRTSV